MPPILVSPSVRCITTQVLVIAKLNIRKGLFWETLFVISNVPAMNYLFKVSNWSTRTRCEYCSRLRVKILEQCQWLHSSVFIVNCEHISSFGLIVEFEQANVWWVHIKKTDTFEDKMPLSFKMTCCTFVFLQILVAGRLIRSYLTQLILSCCKLLLSC